jgi:hypothetical protein
MVRRTRYGETPLHIACRKGKAKVVQQIVAWAVNAGEDVLKNLLSADDNSMRKPQDVANVSLIRDLLNNGGRSDTVVKTEAAASKDEVQILESLQSTLYNACV